MVIFSLIVSAEARIQNLVEDLGWSFLQKQFITTNHNLFSQKAPF